MIIIIYYFDQVDDEDLVEVKKNGFLIPKKALRTISVPEGKRKLLDFDMIIIRDLDLRSVFQFYQIFYFSFIAYQVLIPKGKDGSVEVSVKLAGYNEEVLAKNDVKNAVSKIQIFSF